MISTHRKRTTKTYGLKSISSGRRDIHDSSTAFIRLHVEGGKSNELVTESIDIDLSDMKHLIDVYESIKNQK